MCLTVAMVCKNEGSFLVWDCWCVCYTEKAEQAHCSNTC